MDVQEDAGYETTNSTLTEVKGEKAASKRWSLAKFAKHDIRHGNFLTL